MGHIWKEKLLDYTLTTNGVSNIINLNKILKYRSGYKKFKEQIKTSLDYFRLSRINVFAMIKQLRPLTFFVTFTTGINNWSIFTTTFKNLCDEHVIKNTISNNVDTLNIKDLGRNYPITNVHYYEHKMNSFHKLLKNTKTIFDKGKDYFLITKFQASKLLHDYGLLWIENAPHFDVNSNESIKKIVDKYLIIDQTILKKKFVLYNSIDTNKHVERNANPFVDLIS